MTAIIGTRTATARDRTAYNLAALNPHDRFINEMFDPLWTMATLYDIDPLVMVAQSFKETGGGKFMGNVPPTYFNTAGIKIRDISPVVFPNGSETPLAHSQYGSWYGGAESQAQHLYAYMGKLLPPGYYLVDPRWVWVFGKYSLTQVEELGGRWAPSPTYGNEIVVLMNKFAI